MFYIFYNFDAYIYLQQGTNTILMHRVSTYYAMS